MEILFAQRWPRLACGGAREGESDVRIQRLPNRDTNMGGHRPTLDETKRRNQSLQTSIHVSKSVSQKFCIGVWHGELIQSDGSSTFCHPESEVGRT